MSIKVEFDSEAQVQRLLFLASQDHARIIGNMVIAERRISEAEEGGHVPGRQLDRARSTLASGPKQEAVITGAQDCLRDGMREFRKANNRT